MSLLMVWVNEFGACHYKKKIWCLSLFDAFFYLFIFYYLFSWKKHVNLLITQR